MEVTWDQHSGSKLHLTKINMSYQALLAIRRSRERKFECWTRNLLSEALNHSSVSIAVYSSMVSIKALLILLDEQNNQI